MLYLIPFSAHFQIGIPTSQISLAIPDDLSPAILELPCRAGLVVGAWHAFQPLECRLQKTASLYLSGFCFILLS